MKEVTLAVNKEVGKGIVSLVQSKLRQKLGIKTNFGTDFFTKRTGNCLFWI